MDDYAHARRKQTNQLPIMDFKFSSFFGSDDQLMENITTVLNALEHFKADFCLTGARFFYPESEAPEEFIIFVSPNAPCYLIKQHLITQGYFLPVEGNPHCLLSRLDTVTPFITILPLRHSIDFEEHQSTFGIGLERLTRSGAGGVFRGETIIGQPAPQWNLVSVPELMALKLLAWSHAVGDRENHAHDICRLLSCYTYLENESVLDALPDIYFSEEEFLEPSMPRHAVKHWTYVLGTETQEAIARYDNDHRFAHRIAAVVKAAVASTQLAEAMSKWCVEELPQCKEVLASFVRGMNDADYPF